MAILMVIDRDNTNPDPVKNARGCYKRGDIVEVLDDSKYDGDTVNNPIAPPFYLIRVTGVTKEQLLHAARHEMNSLDPMGHPLRRRLYAVDFSVLSAPHLTQLETTRYLSLTLQQARKYVKNKTTGESV